MLRREGATKDLCQMPRISRGANLSCTREMMDLGVRYNM